MPGLISEVNVVPDIFPNNIQYLLNLAYLAQSETEKIQLQNQWQMYLNENGDVLFDIQVQYFFETDPEGLRDFIFIRRLDLNKPVLCSGYILSKDCHCTCKQSNSEFINQIANLSLKLLSDIRRSMI